MVYLTLHILAIFIILLMAVMRQSLLSVGYVFFLIPRFKDAAEVLDQRSMNQNNKKIHLTAEIKRLKVELIKAREAKDVAQIEELEE